MRLADPSIDIALDFSVFRSLLPFHDTRCLPTTGTREEGRSTCWLPKKAQSERAWMEAIGKTSA